MYIALPNRTNGSKQSDVSTTYFSGRRLPEQLWIAISERLHLQSDNEEFRRLLDHLVDRLQRDLEASHDIFPKQLKRDYRSLKLRIQQFKRLFAPQPVTDTSASEAIDQLISAVNRKIDFERVAKDLYVLEEACETLELRSTLSVSPRGKRFEKVFLRHLSKILDRCPVSLTARQRAGIAIDLIRWAGGHPASPSSIARYMRHVRRSTHTDLKRN